MRDNLATLERRGVEVVPPEERPTGRRGLGRGPAGRPGRHRRRASWSCSGRGAGAATWPGARVVVSAGRHPRAARPGALHHQPLVGQAGPRPRRGGGPPRRGGHPGHLVAARPPADVAPAVDAGRRGDGGRHGARPSGPRAEGADVVVMAAAVADFRPEAVGRAQALQGGRACPSSSSSRRPTSWPAWSAPRRPGQVLVGFAAETHDARRRGVGASSSARASTSWS